VIATRSLTSSAHAHAMEEELILKILMIGDSGVGKSSLLCQFADGRFTPAYTSTIATDFRIKTLDIDGKPVKLQIWDTAGQERFRTITASYYRNAHGIVVVYDVMDEDSYRNVTQWLNEIDRYAQENVNTILVANKCDVLPRFWPEVEGKGERGGNGSGSGSGSKKNERKASKTAKVDSAVAREWAESMGIPFCQTSARSSSKTKHIFVGLVRDILARLEEEGPLDEVYGPKLELKKPIDEEKEVVKTKGCCS
jgi:Ras-related protein Rab-1A